MRVASCERRGGKMIRDPQSGSALRVRPVDFVARRNSHLRRVPIIRGAMRDLTFDLRLALGGGYPFFPRISNINNAPYMGDAKSP